MNSTQLHLQCSCGTIEGQFRLEAKNGAPGTCYCDDCQAYARWLGPKGIVNDHGGTNIVQTWPSLVAWHSGTDRIRCMKLSEKGLLRVYADCCRVPLMNLMHRPKLPFVGLSTDRLTEAGREQLVRVLGPFVGVQGRFAQGNCPPGVLKSASISVIARALGLLARGYFANAHFPSPAFDESGQLLFPLRVLTPDETATLYEAARGNLQ